MTDDTKKDDEPAEVNDEPGEVNDEPGEVDAAAKIFADYLAKGWKGYAISRDGSLKRRILVFSPAAEEIVLVDPKDESQKITKTKQQFIREFGSVQALPKTWKG